MTVTERPLRIAVACHPGQGGSGIVATELAMALAERGHEVHIVSHVKPFRLFESSSVQWREVKVLDYPLFRFRPHDLCLANTLAELVEERHIDIIHAHYAVPHATAAILASEIVETHRVKVITTAHGTDITLVGVHHNFYRVCRYAMEQCHQLTAVSHWLADLTREEFNLDDAPLVIPNFVDCHRFTPDGRAPYPAHGEPFTILHVSNFRPVKRVCDIVRVFARIREQLPARLLMVGNGPEKGLAQELCGELRISDDVEFVGSTPQIADIFRQAHLFLLLSNYESFGLSALEAMACATPVVASKAGGLVEVIEDGVSGALCPVGNLDAIAARAVSLLQDKATWRAASMAARDRAHDHFCKSIIVPQYEAMYQRVLADWFQQSVHRSDTPEEAP